MPQPRSYRRRPEASGSPAFPSPAPRVGLASPAPDDTSPTFSTRETAVLIGVAEASVKRLADSGALSCLRAQTRGVRRFGAAQVASFLRQRSEVPGVEPTVAAAAKPFALAAARDDLAGATALALELFVAGVALEQTLDGLVTPAAGLSAEGFVEKLLERVWPLGPRERKGNWPAMVLSVGRARTAATFQVTCFLRSRGLEAMNLMDGLGPLEAADVAARLGARLAVFVFSGALAADDVERQAIDAAARLAATLPPSSVCAVGPRLSPLPAGVLAVGTMSDLGRVVAALGGAAR